MTIEVPDDYTHLLDNQVASIATIGPRGYPQVVATWFLWEDGLVKTTVHTSRQWFKNAVARPKASFFFSDPTNPYRTLELRGDVRIESDPDRAFMRRQFAKYATTPEDWGGEIQDREILILDPYRVRTWG